MTTLDVPTKPWYKSTTLWTSVISVLLLVLSSPEVTGFIKDYPTATIVVTSLAFILQAIRRSLASQQPLAFTADTKTRSLRV